MVVEDEETQTAKTGVESVSENGHGSHFGPTSTVTAGGVAFDRGG